MRKPRLTLLAAVLAIAGALAGTASRAQQVGPPFFPQTLPSNTVVGRIQGGIGPASAIPFATLGPLLNLSNTITIGSTPIGGGINGDCLTVNGTVVGQGSCGSGGGGGGGSPPGGSNTQLQYNNGGSAFGGISGATTNNGIALTIASGDLILSGSGSGSTTLNSAAVGGGTITLPAGSTTLAGLGTNQTFTGINTVSGNENITGIFQANGNTMTFPGSAATLAGLGIVETWTAAQTFTNSDLLLLGSASGATTFTSANTGPSNFTITFPAVTDQVVARTTLDTLTNKTITSSTNSIGGVTAAFGGDAKGDIYTNGGSANIITRLAIGTAGQCLLVTSGLPSWGSCGSGVGLTVGTTTISGGSAGNLLYTDGSLLQASGGVTWVGTGQVLNALGTITTNKIALNVTGTWNAGGTKFDAPLLENITNTASAAGSALFDFQVGGNSQFAYYPNASTLEVGNSTTATAFHVYNTVDTLGGPTNYERGTFDFTTTANKLTIGMQAGGSGTVRDINIVTGTGGAIYFNANGGNTSATGLNPSSAIAGIWTITNGVFGWVPSFTTNSSQDTGVSRDAAGVVDIGNGLTGDVTGAVQTRSYVHRGATPTFTGTCTAPASKTGGNTAGTWTVGVAGACAGGTYILTFAFTAPTGWACDAEDQSTITDTVKQSGTSQTTATFTATTANNDVVNFKCAAY